jgi:hypothetical protein
MDTCIPADLCRCNTAELLQEGATTQGTFHNLTEYNVDVETMCGTSFTILPDSTATHIDNIDGSPICGCTVNYYKIIDGHDIILMHDQVITDDNYIYESIK